MAIKLPSETSYVKPFGVDANSRTETTSLNVGTVGTATGLSVVEYGDDTNHRTVITLASTPVGSPVAAADLGFGVLCYTLPAGSALIKSVQMSVALTGTTPIVADTPDVGVGSVVAVGAVATLTTSTWEDYVTGQTSGAISGTNTSTLLSVATAGALTGIAVNAAASSKAFYLNCADGWAAAGDVTAIGTIVIDWTFVS